VANIEFSRFEKIGFDDYRQRALDPSISKYEKIAAPDEYRAGHEEAIFQDILRKLPKMSQPGSLVIDIGCGCTDLPLMIMRNSELLTQQLVMIDSHEMLSLLPDHPATEKFPARFPDCAPLFERFAGKADSVIAYGVLQSVFNEASICGFLDSALSLLAPGGAMLIGDIPNMSKRKRFFASESGSRFHKKFMQTETPPTVLFNRPEPGKIDDAVLFGLAGRARLQGYDAYIVPMAPELPLANRREDMLIVRP
jgi:hypothetical protein